MTATPTSTTSTCTVSTSTPLPPLQQLEKPNMICKFYQNGNCKYGEKCSYSHQLNQDSIVTTIIKDIDNSSSLTTPAQTKEAETEHNALSKQSKLKCKFFNSQRGCQRGDQCEYLHERYNRFLQKETNEANKKDSVKNNRDKTAKSNNQKNKKPKNKLLHTLNMLKASYSFNFTLNKGNTQADIKLNIVPSDPEFPYQLDQLILQFILRIDDINNLQNIAVSSESIPLKFTINIKQSLKEYNDQNLNATIFEKLSWLDKNLESILSKPAAETIKFVNFKQENLQNSNQESSNDTNLDNPSTQISLGNPIKRQSEIKQIETRFKNTAQVIKDDAQSTLINIRFEPSDPDFSFKREMSYISLSLIVPKEYPHPDFPSKIIASIPINCRIPEYSFRNLETGFLKYSQKMPSFSLLQKLNWLDRQCEALLKLPKPPSTIPHKNGPSLSRKDDPEVFSELQEKMEELEIDELDGSESSEFDYEYESSTEEEEEEEEEETESSEKHFERPLHRGIKAYFGLIDMENISLIQIDSIGLVVRCNRCTTSFEIQPLVPNATQQRSCSKCSMPMTIGLRPDLIHQSNFVLGYLDLQNCQAVDLTLCHLTPTCSKCDHQIQNPAFRKVSFSIPLSSQCRSCFAKVSFEAQSLQFVQLGASMLPKILNNAPKRNKNAKQVLAIGQPLPKFGTCRHYAKSYRWFRFPCCGMLYPCDECHNTQANCVDPERARVTICGFCSKEQKFEQEAKCTGCAKTLASSTRGKTFWEGGKGARNQLKMSRNDSKKYSGLNKTVSRKQTNLTKVK